MTEHNGAEPGNAQPNSSGPARVEHACAASGRPVHGATNATIPSATPVPGVAWKETHSRR